MNWQSIKNNKTNKKTNHLNTVNTTTRKKQQ